MHMFFKRLYPESIRKLHRDAGHTVRAPGVSGVWELILCVVKWLRKLKGIISTQYVSFYVENKVSLQYPITGHVSLFLDNIY